MYQASHDWHVPLYLLYEKLFPSYTFLIDYKDQACRVNLDYEKTEKNYEKTILGLLTEGGR